jgi:hypothetical protein
MRPLVRVQSRPLINVNCSTSVAEVVEWQTHSLEGAALHGVRVQVPPSASKLVPARVAERQTRYIQGVVPVQV